FHVTGVQTCALPICGNAYALIVRSAVRREVREIIPIRPDRVTVQVDDDLTVRYRISGADREFTAREILHLRGLSTDGFMGLSPITVAREAIGLAIATQNHGAALFRNGARPGGVLEHPGKIGRAHV